jgi:SAM-dependent methyltransferase
MTATMTPNFDLIAAPYRFLEYLTFGPALTRCRNHFLPRLADRRRALILGDGDGRFTARLLASDTSLTADAVDLSPSMLALLTRRATSADPTAAGRLRTHVADARTFAPKGPYDLVVSHFFLDCLTQLDLESLAARIRPRLALNALWLVSEFRIPSGPLRLPAQAVVRSLYLGFRLLTGLRTTNLPNHPAALTSAGLTRTAQHLSLGGLLATELWALTPSPSFNSTAQPAYSPSMQLPPQKPRTPHPPDPVPDPEPASPSLPEPDPAVFHPAGPKPAKS